MGQDTGLVDLIKDAAVGEELGLGSLPSAEDLIDCEQLDIWALLAVFRVDLGIAGPIEILRNDFLADRGVEVSQIRLGYVPGSFFVYHLVDDRYRRFGQNTDRRIDDREFVRSEFFEAQIGLVFPSNQDIPQLSLHERGG